MDMNSIDPLLITIHTGIITVRITNIRI